MNRRTLLLALAASTVTTFASACAARPPEATVGSLANVRIFDRAQGRELPVYWHEGRAYVVGRPGNEYELRVRSRTGEDLLAVMSVDGVNVLSGETASPAQGGYVVQRWGQVSVAGWRKSLSDTAAFYFTSLPDSYAARTGRPDNVGVIGVALFRRQPEAPPPPISIAPEDRHRDSYARREAPAKALGDAMQAPSAAAAPSPSLGTGHGRQEHNPARYVNFVRSTPYPIETITIHYDSYRNLVARGVLKAPVPQTVPNPFPGFVPDPA